MKTTKILLTFAFLMLGAFSAMGLSGAPTNVEWFSASPTNTNELFNHSVNYGSEFLFNNQKTKVSDDNFAPNAAGDIDPTFTGGVMLTNTQPAGTASVYALAVQPDGKHLIGGGFGTVNGTGRNNLVRLNADGTVDYTFDSGVGFNGSVTCIVVQPDGKILVGGNFSTFTDYSNGVTAKGSIARLNADGSLDVNFSTGSGANNTVNSIALSPDGKIYIGGDFLRVDGNSRSGVARLLADGAVDLGFAQVSGANSGVDKVLLLPNGKIVIGGRFTSYNSTVSNYLARINTDGSLDTTFNIGTGASSSVRGVVLQSDGKIIIGGSFLTFNGANARYIARLNIDGSLDSFLEGSAACTQNSCRTLNQAYQISIAQDNKVYVSSADGGGIRGTLRRFNADGSVDTSFNTVDPGFNFTLSITTAYIVQADGMILTSMIRQISSSTLNTYTQLRRYNSSGGEDGTYNPIIASVGQIRDLQLQPDGKLIAGGLFYGANASARFHLARFNADGTLDAAFTPRTDMAVNKIIVQPDGKIFIAGIFSTANGVNRGKVARFNANGTLDTTFNVQVGADSNVEAAALQSDGKIVIGGCFSSYNGATRRKVARINSDGTLDTTFNSDGTGVGGSNNGGCNTLITGVALQPDGKILIGGTFTSYNEIARPYFARLNIDGTLDLTFDPGNGPNGSITAINVLPNGKMLIGGGFISYNGATRNNLARVNANGSLDTTFGNSAAPNGGIDELYVQADGKILISGAFTTVAGQVRRGIARLNADGTLDQNFGNNSGGAQPSFSQTTGLAVDEANSKLYFGGAFTTFNNTGRGSLVRLFTGTTTNCTYSLSPTAANVANTAGSGSFNITTQAGCAWTAQSSQAFLTTSSTGSGSGTVNYAYAANTGAARTATITVGGQTFTFNQAGNPLCTNGVAVSLPNLNAARNAIITVPITVGDTTGKNITSYDFDLRFDSTIVRPVASAPVDSVGTLSSNFTITPNSNTPGKLVVSAFGVNALAGAGTLLNLKFEVVGNASQVASLNWAAFQFNEGEPCAATVPGSITIVNGSIAGSVNYHFVASGQQPKAMANIAVTAAGTPQISATTNAAGAYRLDGFGTGAYTVTPAKTGDVNGISSQDAARVAQFVAGLVTLTANQQIAADATNNGSVSSQDAARIAQFVAGITVTGATGQWKFAPASRSYAAVTSELTGENYEAILVGEVTGNWTAPSLRSNEAETESKIKRIFAEKLLDSSDAAPNAVNVSLPTMTAAPGTTITIPVTVGNLTGQNVTSYDFDVRFNQAVLRPVAATPASNAGTLSSGFTITPNPNTPGKLVVSAFGIAPLSGEGTLLNLNFEVIGQAGAVSPLTWQTFAFNEGDPAATTANGQLTIPGTIRRTPYDFDGDGKADVSVFRPDNGVWYFNNSQTGFGGVQFGLGTDKLVPADYDGDGKTDVAVFRNGNWYIQRSQLGFTSVFFGNSDDVLVPADYDGDGKADVAVFRPSNGTWYRLNSSNGAFVYDVFGLGTDKPVPADYDGDGRANVAVFRPSNGTWYTSTNPATNYGAVIFGSAEDKPVPADYDGDGKTDVAVFRPSNGSWYLQRSQAGFTGLAFGLGTDLPVAADYDGDGKADIAVFRSGTWYLNRSTSGFAGIAFGANTDKPVPNAFIR